MQSFSQTWVNKMPGSVYLYGGTTLEILNAPKKRMQKTAQNKFASKEEKQTVLAALQS